jgi:pyruvate/2-oxoglutarate dehydrogenase complex dihydrolipoamide acyltransferase (E2) component
VPVLTVVALVGAADEALPEGVGGGAAPAPAAAAPAAQATPAAAAPAAAPVAAGGGAKASPRARKLAEEKGMDLGAVAGSGPGGRVLSGDVAEAAAAQGS